MKRSEMLKTLKGYLRSTNKDHLLEYQSGNISMGKLLEELAETALECAEHHMDPYNYVGGVGWEDDEDV